MSESLMLEIPLPAGMKPSPMDLEMLKAMLHSILCQRFEFTKESECAIQELEAAGWNVHLGPTWLVVARRGSEVEDATGKTPDLAIEHLHRYLRHDTRLGGV